MNYLRILKSKATFPSSAGELTPQQLWDLPIGDEKKDFGSVTTLDSMAVALEEQYNASGTKSFIRKKTKKNSMLKDKLNFVLLVIEDKQEDRERYATGVSTRTHNQGIDELIAKKQAEELANLSVEELLALKK